MADEAAQAAADVIADLVDDGADAAATDVVEQPAPEPEDVPVVDLPSFEADTEGIEDLLSEPDDEPDLPEPPVFSAQEDEEPAWDDDEEKRRLKAELAKAQKRLQWAEQQRVQASKKQWAQEAQRRFPLADVDEIDASSRRAFLRKAQEQHTRYERKLNPVMKQIEQLREAAVAEVKTQARAEAEQAWGKPTSGPQAPMVESAEDAAALDRSRYRSPYEMLKARMQHDPRFKNGI